MINVLHELNRLEAEGTLSDWVTAGIISPVLVQQREIYLKHDSYIQSSVSKAVALTWTAELFGCSERTVLRAIARFCAKKNGSGRRTRYLYDTHLSTENEAGPRASCA